MGIINPAEKKKGCCSKKCCLITLGVVVVVLVLGYFNIQYVPIPFADLEGSSSAEPIVIYCERTVKDADKYMAVWTPFATHTQEGGAGVRAVFSFMSKVRHTGPHHRLHVRHHHARESSGRVSLSAGRSDEGAAVLHV